MPKCACRTLPAPDAATAPRGRTLERRPPAGIARERETPGPASRGSAKPAPMTLRHAKVRAAPSPHRMPPPLPEAAPLERRSPTGIARERETRADDPPPCQSECRTARSQPRIARPLPAPRPRDPLSLASGIPISVTRVRGSEQTPGDGGDSHYVVSRTGVGYNSDSEETPY